MQNINIKRNLTHWRRVYKTLSMMLFFLINNAKLNEASVGGSWITFVRETKSILEKCPNNNTLPYFSWSCLTNGSLEILEKITMSDVIPLTDTVRLIRYRGNDLVDEPTTLHKHNKGSKLNKFAKRHFNDRDVNKNATWAENVLQRIGDVLTTHKLQMDLDSSPVVQVTQRARHRQRNQMLPMMVFGVTALGMILVPLGFQFLAVLGGKALLLAKMALLLASINGVKRVATSGVHYGLYHTDPHFHHGPWERSEAAYSHPRNLEKHL